MSPGDTISFLTEFAAVRLRTYDIYPTGSGYSAAVQDYRGRKVSVVATSIRQAYRLAGAGVWIDPDNLRSGGVLYTYRRGAGAPGDYFLWCGCRSFGLGGGAFDAVRHGSGIKAIQQAVTAHLGTCGWGATDAPCR